MTWFVEILKGAPMAGVVCVIGYFVSGYIKDLLDKVNATMKERDVNFAATLKDRDAIGEESRKRHMENNLETNRLWQAAVIKLGDTTTIALQEMKEAAQENSARVTAVIDRNTEAIGAITLALTSRNGVMRKRRLKAKRR